MKKIIFLLFLTLFICEGFSQVGKQTGGGIYFLNSKVGWMNWRFTPISQNILKTTDGGLSWQDAKLPVNWQIEVVFLNKKLGFMQGFQDTTTKLLKTTDGGSTWNFIYTSNNTGLYSFLNDTLGYAVKRFYNEGDYSSSYSFLLKTTDGGKTWKDILKIPYTTDYIFVHGIDDITLAGGDVWEIYNIQYGFVMRTKGEQYSHKFDYPFRGVCFLDSLKGFGTSANKLYKTIDGGVNWDTIQGINGEVVFFTDSFNGYLDSWRSFSKTTDGGKTWVQKLHMTYDPMQRCYIDSLNLFEKDFFSDQQKFCKSTDGGYSWECLPLNLISSDKENYTPLKYSLQQNFPNPFNPSTTIKYSVAKNNDITLKVYDVLGNLIKTLVDEYKPAGEYQTEFKAENNLPSGIYFYTLKTGEYTETKKMLFLK